MLVIGLTGNIGSGKSTVLDFFKQCHVPTLSADAIARTLTQPGTRALQAIQDYFGSQIIQPDNTLNRKALRTIILEDNTKRLWLESLLHPMIRSRILEDIAHLTAAYCVVEIPLLYDKKNFPFIDRILLVKTDPEEQIARIMQRNHWTQQQARAMLSLQPGDATREHIADDIIYNTGTLEACATAVQTWDTYYRSII